MILYGFHTLQALLQSDTKIQSMYLQDREGSERNQELKQLAKDKKINVQTFGGKDKAAFEREFKRHGGTDQELASSQGAFALVPEPQYSDLEELLITLEDKKFPIILFLDEITDPQNLGSILRSAAAFGVSALVITEHRSRTITEVAARISSGGFAFVPVCRVVNLVQSIELAKEKGFWILGMSERAKDGLSTVRLDAPLAIVIGNEEKGMRQLTEKNCDWLIKLPAEGQLQSLNAAVATGATLALVRYVQSTFE